MIDETSAELRDRMAIKSPVALLSFSCGKDSIASWLSMREKFEVHPFFMYLVPDLEFVEASLDYYERFFGQKIARYPNSNLYRMLNELVYQPPNRIKAVWRTGLPAFDRDDVAQCFRDDYKLPTDSYVAIGNRITDNLTRRMSYKKTGAVNENRKTFWPVFDWKNDDLVSCFRHHGVRLPIDYRMFGRTFDGLGVRYLYPIKQLFPRDFEKILEWFPLADLEVWRYEHQRH